MTGLFDRLGIMMDEDPDRFKKITLEILNFIERKVAEEEGFWGTLDWKWLSNGDVDDRKGYVEYIQEVRRIVKGEIKETHYEMLEYTRWDPDYDVAWEFLSYFHDVAHDMLKAGLIGSDSYLFGDAISGMVG